VYAAVVQSPTISRAGADSWSLMVSERLSELLGAGPVLRYDLAWVVMAPEMVRPHEVDLPPGNPRTRLRLLADWSRQALSLRATERPDGCLVVLCPPLTPAAAEWVERMLSFYADTVGMVRLNTQSAADHADYPAFLHQAWQAFLAHADSPWKDAWRAPVARPWAEDPGPVLQNAGKTTAGGRFVYLGAVLGSDRLALQTYRLRPHGRANRFHAHSDVDECYLVWEGNGTMRCGARTVPLEAGDVVAKPAGSRLAIEFVAGPEGMTIFDIEGWRDFQQTDVVLYPDHREWYLRGPGLEVVAPEAALLPAKEVMNHYEEDYRRSLHGNREDVRPRNTP
jgi:uncharacterized cupin superfamily protein